MASAPVNISLPPEIRERLARESRETERPASAIIRLALKAYWAAEDQKTA